MSYYYNYEDESGGIPGIEFNSCIPQEMIDELTLGSIGLIIDTIDDNEILFIYDDVKKKYGAPEMEEILIVASRHGVYPHPFSFIRYGEERQDIVKVKYDGQTVQEYQGRITF